jgi:hypothetical protein
VYSNWTSQVAANSFTEDFCFAIPYSNDANGATLTKAIKIVDDVMFAVESTSATVHVFDLAKGGVEVGVMTPSYQSGWVDTCYGLDAVRVVDAGGGGGLDGGSASYLIAVEEDWKAKTNVYVWDGQANRV